MNLVNIFMPNRKFSLTPHAAEVGTPNADVASKLVLPPNAQFWVGAQPPWRGRAAREGAHHDVFIPPTISPSHHPTNAPSHQRTISSFHHRIIPQSHHLAICRCFWAVSGHCCIKLDTGLAGGLFLLHGTHRRSYLLTHCLLREVHTRR